MFAGRCRRGLLRVRGLAEGEFYPGRRTDGPWKVEVRVNPPPLIKTWNCG